MTLSYRRTLTPMTPSLHDRLKTTMRSGMTWVVNDYQWHQRNGTKTFTMALPDRPNAAFNELMLELSQFC
jgi:hypothetical protein